jgi:hypothetical protein
MYDRDTSRASEGVPATIDMGLNGQQQTKHNPGGKTNHRVSDLVRVLTHSQVM